MIQLCYIFGEDFIMFNISSSQVNHAVNYFKSKAHLVALSTALATAGCLLDPKQREAAGSYSAILTFNIVKSTLTLIVAPYITECVKGYSKNNPESIATSSLLETGALISLLSNEVSKVEDVMAYWLGLNLAPTRDCIKLGQRMALAASVLEGMLSNNKTATSPTATVTTQANIPVVSARKLDVTPQAEVIGVAKAALDSIRDERAITEYNEPGERQLKVQ